MDAVLVGIICIGAVALFVRGRIPPDIVAVVVLGVLVVLGLVTPKEAISGFASPAVITVGAMFVLSAGLRETGALTALARFLTQVGRNGPLLQIAVTPIVAAVSAFINNTAAVAVFLPMILGVARRRGISPSKLLIPLSYASQFGGVCTLIGTSTNLLVNSLAVGAGLVGFGLFDFASVGLVLVGAGCLYLLTVGWWLLPNRPASHIDDDGYALRAYIFSMTMAPEGRWCGRTVAQSGLAGRDDVSLLEIVRDGQRFRPRAADVLVGGDRLILQGAADSLFEVSRQSGLVLDQEAAGAAALEGDGLRLVEVVVAPHARLIGQSWSALESSWAGRAAPMAIARRDSVLHTGLAGTPLVAGDALLLLMASTDVPVLREEADFIVLSERDNPGERRRRAPLAVGLVVAVVAVAALEWLPIEIAALLGAAAMAITGCVGIDRLYRNVELRVLVLLAAMLPLGIAIERSGAASALVDGGLSLALGSDPLVALAIVYGVTALLTEIITNNATAVLMTPIALALAERLGVSPYPFLVAVAFAASTSFSTPIGYQTNTMVYSAGGYTFRDFLRVGVPLNLLFWAISMWAIPRYFPF